MFWQNIYIFLLIIYIYIYKWFCILYYILIISECLPTALYIFDSEPIDIWGIFERVHLPIPNLSHMSNLGVAAMARTRDIRFRAPSSTTAL